MLGIFVAVLKSGASGGELCAYQLDYPILHNQVVPTREREP